MKRVLFFLSIFFCICTQAFAMTYANEPKDYNGLNWGSSISDFNKSGRQFAFKSSLANQNVDIYTPVDQSQNIFNKKFDEITYHFYKSQFFMVRAIKYNDNQMSQTLLQTISSQHGRPTQQNDNIHQKTTTYHWQGNTTTIVLFQDFMRKETTLTFYNHRLHLDWSMLSKKTQQPAKIKERS